MRMCLGTRKPWTWVTPVKDDKLLEMADRMLKAMGKDNDTYGMAGHDNEEGNDTVELLKHTIEHIVHDAWMQ